MGTSLTGLTPATTYDALIKVGDNGPLTGSLKTISDGLGNDSTLSLSTGAASIGGTLAVTGVTTATSGVNVGSGTAGRNALTQSDFRIASANDTNILNAIASNSLMTIKTDFYGGGSATPLVLQSATNNNQLYLSTAGNVGIGTSGPNGKLHISNSDTNNTYPSTASINVSNFDGGAFGRTMGVNFSVGSGTNSEIISGVYGIYTGYGSSVAGALSFVTNNGSSALAEKARITSDGFLRMASGTGGIQFNGDTAAANALDDYEEGTWTPIVTFGGGTTGQTYNGNTGTYTKIGRQVTVTCYVEFTNKGTSTGSAVLTGLPFTIGSGIAFFSAPSIGDVRNITFTSILGLYANHSQTSITMGQTSTLGTFTVLDNTNFANNSEFILTATYFV